MQNTAFRNRLDDTKIRSDWGTDLLESVECVFLKDKSFTARKLSNLVAGFSNRCNLDCSFCGVHSSKIRNIPSQDIKMDRLIELVRRQKEETGEKIDHFRIGNTGEPLIHKDFRKLVENTEDYVGYYSLISNMNIKNVSRIQYVADHPQFDWINISCDAGDAQTYAKMRTNGNFHLLMKNAQILAASGKKLVINAVVFKENEKSLLALPRIFRDMGVHEIHVFYPLNPNHLLNKYGLHKQNLEEFIDFLKQMRSGCEKYNMRLSSDSWIHRPELIGVLPDIENEMMYNTYINSPCDALYHLILYPDGTYNNCSVLNRLGLAKDKNIRPVYDTELMAMLNTPTVLKFRKLQMLGYFAPPCKEICGKKDSPRTEEQAARIMSIKYPQKECTDLETFETTLLSKKQKFAVRALSPAMKNVCKAYPVLNEQLALIIDRDQTIQHNGVKVISPEDAGKNTQYPPRILLIASDREVVFNSVFDQVQMYSEIYKLMVNGTNPKDYRVQQLWPI